MQLLDLTEILESPDSPATREREGGNVSHFRPISIFNKWAKGVGVEIERERKRERDRERERERERERAIERERKGADRQLLPRVSRRMARPPPAARCPLGGARP